VGDSNNLAVQNPKCDEPLLIVLESIIFDRNRIAVKELLGTDEVDPMLPDVRLALRLIPSNRTGAVCLHHATTSMRSRRTTRRLRDGSPARYAAGG
jgi:hypothetical protein